MGHESSFIQAENFSEDSLRKSLSSLKIRQLQLLETCLHAFELLGRLSGSGIPFLFKGGTSLLLHTGQLRRISTDIDIVTSVNGEDLLRSLNDLAAGDPFISFDEHDRGLRGRSCRLGYPAPAGKLPNPALSPFPPAFYSLI